MQKRVLFALMAALVLVAGVALAGEKTFHKIHMGGPGMFGHGAELAEQLDLSAEQKESAKQLHEELMAKAEPVMEQHRQQMEEVHTLLDAGNANATEIGQKMIAAHATRKQLHAIHEDGFERFKSLLTAEQQEKLEELKKDFPHRGMRMRMRHH